MKKASIRVLLIIVWLLSQELVANCQAFKKKVDSLQNILQQELADTTEINTLNRISTAQHGIAYREAIKYAQLAIKKSQDSDYKYGLAKGFQNIALTSWANGFYKDALEYHLKALKIFKEEGFQNELAEAYNKIGLVHYYIAEYKEAIAYLEKSEAGYRERGDTVNLARVLNNLGLIYDSRGYYGVSTKYIIESLQLNQSFSLLRDQQARTYSKELIHENEFINRQQISEKQQQIASFDQSRPSEKLASLHVSIAENFFFLKEYKEALEFYARAGELFSLLGENVPLGHCIRDQAECYVQLQQLDSAFVLFEQAERIYLKAENYIRLAAVVAQLGETHALAGHPEQAILDYKRVVLLDDTLGHKAAKSRIQQVLASVLLKENRLPEALTIARASYKVAEEIGSLVRRQKSAQQLYEIYKRMGQPNEALKYLEESTQLQQRFDNDLTNRQIAELQISYESEEKQKEINQLNVITSLNQNVLTLQRGLIWLLSISLLSILVLLIVVNGRLKKIKLLKSDIEEQKIQIVEQNQVLEKKGHEKELLIGEIHHRVKNNLQIIASLLRLEQREISDPAAANVIFESQNRVQSMSLLHQRLYQQGNYESISLKEYTQDILQHLLKVHRVSEKEVRFKGCESTIELDMDAAVTFGLFVNEAFTNIFKHAFSRGKVLEISCECQTSSGFIYFTITDNGPGFKDKIAGKDHFGIHLMEMLAEELQGHVEFSNRKDTKGAALLMKFKIQDEKSMLT